MIVAGCSPMVGRVLTANKSSSVHLLDSTIYSVSRLVKNYVQYADLRHVPARMYTAVNSDAMRDMIDNQNLSLVKVCTHTSTSKH